MDRDTGQELVRRPDDKGTLQITRSFYDDRASVTLYGVFVGDRIDARDASVVLDSYAVYNLAGEYYVTDSARVFFRIDNLFDEDYEEITGFTTPPFSGYAGLNLIY